MSQDTSHDKNPFEVLGLEGDEDLPTIRKAFLRLAAQLHPDRLRAKPPDEREKGLAQFLEAKKSFELLSAPDKRKEWGDRLQRARAQAAGAASKPATGPATAAPAPPPMSGPVRAPRATPLPTVAGQQLYRLGMFALESKDYGRALDFMTKAAKVAPSPRHRAMELVCRGYQFLGTRFFDKARESFERALELLPECREARMGLEALAKHEQSSRYKR